MSNTFQFKQFTIRQDRCAMKVGTDGVLLGAWCSPLTHGSTSQQILDIGCGTGLVALMLAQRNLQATIHSIEIDERACDQAGENFAASPWHPRLRAVSGCIKDYHPGHFFSLIASNPPWFHESLKSPVPLRNLARHNDGLSNLELLTAVNRLLDANGHFCTIMPTESGREFIQLAEEAGLYCGRLCELQPKPGSPIHRLLIEFSRTKLSCALRPECVTIETEVRHEYTPEFRELTRQFYLRF